MEKLLFIFIISIVLAAITSGQGKERNIRFIVSPMVQPVDTAVYITGNHPALGAWNPSAVPMRKQKDGKWIIELKIEEGYKLEYKFTKGSWGSEAVNSTGATPPNYRLSIFKDTTIEITIDNWKNSFAYSSPLQVTGQVKYFRNVEGQGIKPRDVVVWLPPDYDKNKKKKYPVLYMHDGQNIVDPKTASFGVDWQVDETADSLIKQNRIKEIIIVGIYNTKDRTPEYSYSEKGYAYMDFIIKKLKPMIDSNFRTLKDRQNTATMGSSMGGLISLMLIWEHTDVFSMAGCLSPAFKIDQFNYLPYIEKYKGKKKNIKLYIDNGGKGLEKALLPGIKETLNLLNKKGYKTGKEILWFYDEYAEHNEAAWANRVWKPLLFMFGK